MIQTKANPFVLSELPYEQNALAPCISAQTLSYHYNKHHQGYVSRLNELAMGTEFEGLALEDVILKTAGDAGQEELFNNAAQVWNHDFYWKSLSPKGGGKPKGDLSRLLDASFGGVAAFLSEFAEAGAGLCGSGWIWLVEGKDALKIISTSNAENPLSVGTDRALLVIDVWEHAYYLDYQNRRKDHLRSVLD